VTIAPSFADAPEEREGNAAAVSAPPPAATTGATGPVTGGGATAATPRVDPRLRAVLDFQAKTGATAPGYRRSLRLEREGIVPVLIRFGAPPSTTRFDLLERAGVIFPRGRVPILTGAFLAKIDRRGLALLTSDESVTAIELDLPREVPRPLESSAEATGVAPVRRALRRRDGTLLDGRGTKIADLDSGIWPFHPAFFHADGGRERWVDVDGDGRLTPGVDGVDLDRSGKIDPNEILRTLEVAWEDRPSGFQSSIDYLYVDLDGDGRRGAGASFGEDTPAYGEPIFVIDDLDGDGRPSKEEGLLRLGSSKIAAVRARSTFRRGEARGIARYGESLVQRPELFAYASHGTGVGGILVGGVPDRSKILGLAPGADLLAGTFAEQDPDGTIALVQWAIDEKAHVILTEYAPYTGYPLDGSTEEERLLDAAADQGIVVVKPAGNLAFGGKHRHVELVAGRNEIALKTDQYFGAGRPAYLVSISLLHRGEPRDLVAALQMPDGTKLEIPAESSGRYVPLEGDLFLDTVRRTSARGTHELHVTVARLRDGTTPLDLPAGRWVLSIESDGATGAEVYCGDANNSWARGLEFEGGGDPRTTISHPATSDRGLTVGAWVLDDRAGGAYGLEGALAAYSARGPRIDGPPGIDIVAPDNPVSPTVPDDGDRAVVALANFGGTSGAGPHVAAVAALLRQLDPDAPPGAIEAKILAGASRDAFVGDDETEWGKGKLDLAKILDLPRSKGRPPKIRLVPPARATAEIPFEVDVEIDDDAPDAKVRWDLDDRGVFDGPWSAPARVRVTAPKGPRVIRVEVLDADGWVRGAATTVDVAEPAVPPLPTPAAESSPRASDGCGCRIDRPSAASTPTGVGLLLGALVAARRRRAR
jgi:MYXO-CTERM domain-containing protein